jgi:hypothetical protein
MERRVHGIAVSLTILTTKVPGTTLDTNGQRPITQGPVGVGPSRLLKVAKSISSKNPNMMSVKPRIKSDVFKLRISHALDAQSPLTNSLLLKEVSVS